MYKLTKIAPGIYVDFLKVSLIFITGCDATKFNVVMIIEGLKIEVDVAKTAQQALDRTVELNQMATEARVSARIILEK